MESAPARLEGGSKKMGFNFLHGYFVQKNSKSFTKPWEIQERMKINND